MDNKVKIIIIIALIIVVIMAIKINNKNNDEKPNKIEDTNSYFGENSDEDRNEIIKEFIKNQNIAEPNTIELPKIDNTGLGVPIYNRSENDIGLNLIIK